MNRLCWVRMLDIPRKEADKVVLRFTEGDSEWVDCSDCEYRLIIKDTPWEDPEDDTDILAEIIGKIPDGNEPGRIVFDLTKEDTDLNPTKKYYCRIIEESHAGKIRTVFMGYFRVTDDGDKFNTQKRSTE